MLGAGGIEGLCTDNISDRVEESETLVAVDGDECHPAVDLLLGGFNIKDEGWPAILL